VAIFRENTRYPVELAVKVSCPSWDDYLDLYTTNLSRGGMFIASNVSVPIGTQLDVQLRLPNASTVTLRAEVAHLIGELRARETAQERGMGVTFINLDDETRRALEAMVTVARFTIKTGAPVRLSTRPADESRPPRIDRPGEVQTRTPMPGDEQELAAELARRVGLSPREQLGVGPNADETEIREAYQRAVERFLPAIFQRYPEETQEVVSKLNMLLDYALAELIKR
jgi:uncharacterized protein (TIGR02266 family)